MLSRGMGKTKTVSENGNKDEIKHQTEFLFEKKKRRVFRILVWKLGKGASQGLWKGPGRDQKSQHTLHRFDEKKQKQASAATPYLSLFISSAVLPSPQNPRARNHCTFITLPHIDLTELTWKRKGKLFHCPVPALGQGRIAAWIRRVLWVPT